MSIELKNKGRLGSRPNIDTLRFVLGKASHVMQSPEAVPDLRFKAFFKFEIGRKHT